MQTPQLAQPTMQPILKRAPLARWNTLRGVWQTTQPDLYGRLAPYSAIWPIAGMTRNGSAYRLLSSELPITGSASSFSPTALLRTPLASDPTRGYEPLAKVEARKGTVSLFHQILDLAENPPADTVDEAMRMIEVMFDAGDATPEPSPAGRTSPHAPHQHQ